MTQTQERLTHQSERTPGIFPFQPLLSSSKLDWHGIHFEHYRQPAFAFPEHSFMQNVVVICLGCSAGEETLDGRFCTQRWVPGDVIIIPAKVAHKVVSTGCEFMVFGIEPTLIAHTAYESIAPDRVELAPHFAQNDQLIYQIGLRLKAELAIDELGNRFYVETMGTALSAHLLKHYCTRKNAFKKYTGGLSKQQLQQAIEYIHTYLEQDLSLKDLAELVQMSPYHFSRLFKQFTGQSPQQYIIERRLEKAKNLLTNTNMTIAEIAERSGFKEHSYLTRMFRKYLSITPKVYRKI